MESTVTGAAISIRSVRKRRGAFALRADSLDIPTGFVTGLVGPNGAGKTTLVKAILGLLAVDTGSIALFGRDDPADAATRDRVGVVLDRITAAPEWRAGAVGRRFRLLYRDWDEERFRELLDRFGVPTGNRVGALSRGQSVQLSLAIALAHAPQLLVLDEPSSGLDPVARRELADTIREFMIDPAHTVLFSTHITAELDDLADHVVVMNRGEIAYDGALEDLHERFAVARGAGAVPAAATDATIGVRRDISGRWEALIHVDDTGLFGPDVVIDQATTDDVVVHFAEHGEAAGKELTA
ncbi:ABC transporter ATP-binding protein [Amnibacterium sp.]|uniref:ABC transporter ATP-binding protein n=1 Tax=Amnibacterium sp. TaxID=1872496 RepID=UPI003F7B6992